MVNNLLAMQETWVQFQGWKDPLEEGMATRSSILVWRIPMDRGTLTSWGANPCYFLLLTCVGFFVEWGGSQALTERLTHIHTRMELYSVSLVTYNGK